MKTFALLITTLLVAVTSAQVSLNVPLTITGNADGSVTINPLGINVPASTLATVDGLLAFVQSIRSSVSAGSTQTVNIPITLNQGSVTVTLNGTPYTIDQQTMAGVMVMVQQMGQMIMGGMMMGGQAGTPPPMTMVGTTPLPPPGPMPGPGPMIGGHPPPPPPPPPRG